MQGGEPHPLLNSSSLFFFRRSPQPPALFLAVEEAATKTLSPLCFSFLFQDFLDEILVASLLDPALSRPPLRTALTHPKTKKNTKQKKIGALSRKQVLACSKRFVHDWTSCPFAHAGEKARRRDPRDPRVRYTGIACPDMKAGGGCARGELCPYAHNVFEYWLHPTR